jgi:hypothetical protein
VRASCLTGTIIAAVAALVLAGSAGAAESRVLWQGPVLAGNSVVWMEASAGNASFHRWTAAHGDRALFTSDSIALGRPFVASRKLLAFERSYPSCPPSSGHVCPDGTDAVIGPLSGPYRILARPRTCFLAVVGNALALDGGVAAYLELDCSRQRLRVMVRNVQHGGRPRVVRDASFAGGCCRDIALAGRYVAWRDGHAVVVYDRLARRIAYRARIGPPGIEVDFDFDLQRDGKLAVASRLIQFGQASAPTIAWLSPSAPRLHVLPFRGSSTQINIAGDRIVFQRSLSQKTSALVVSDLRGRARSVARLARPITLRSFDFDGQHLVWASDRVTSTRVDCPPPGQGRPCVRRKSGFTTLSLQTVSTGATRMIARLTFDDAFGR